MNGIPRERDPNLIKLENDVFGKMNQELQKELPNLPKSQETNVKFVSVEDAIRELSDISKSTNDIS